MATRPIFIPDEHVLVRSIDVEFEWHPGFAKTQQQKSVRSLHAGAKRAGVDRPLEISTKSESRAGKELSAFNLKLSLDDGTRIPLECAYQGSKLFANGGPYRDLFFESPRDAKRDARLRSSGDLVSFEFGARTWPLRPPSGFYIWLYLSALSQNERLAEKLLTFDCFTDIAFNPKKSISNQAAAAAVFVTLRRQDRVGEILRQPERLFEDLANEGNRPQKSLF